MPTGGSYYTCMNCGHTWQGVLGKCPVCGNGNTDRVI